MDENIETATRAFWWNGLTRAEQLAYLKQHPTSKLKVKPKMNKSDSDFYKKEENAYHAKAIKKIVDMVNKAAKSKAPYAKKNPDGFYGDIMMQVTPESLRKLSRNKEFQQAAKDLKAAHGIDLIKKVKTSIAGGKAYDKKKKEKNSQIGKLLDVIEKLKKTKQVKQFLDAKRLLAKLKS